MALQNSHMHGLELRETFPETHNASNEAYAGSNSNYDHKEYDQPPYPMPQMPLQQPPYPVPQMPPPQPQMPLQPPPMENGSNPLQRLAHDPAMQSLAKLKNIKVVQVVDFFESAAKAMGNNCEEPNKYEVTDSGGNNIFKVLEKTGCIICTCAMKSRRPFTAEVTSSDVVIMTLVRPCKCMPCTADRLYIEYPPGETVGCIRQHLLDCCWPSYSVIDNRGNTVFDIRGPMHCKIRFAWIFGQPSFEVTDTRTDTQDGCIKKERTNFGKELLTNADNFHIDFPKDASIETKIYLLAATIFIDYTLFEEDIKLSKSGLKI